MAQNLTSLVLGIAAFIMIFTLCSAMYFDSMVSNGSTVDSTFSQQYSKVLGYNASLAAFQNNVSSDTSIWSSVPSGLASTFNVLIAGIGGLASFFTFLTIVPSLFSDVFGTGSGIAIPAAVFTFMSFAVIVYIIMQYYKSVRNAPEIP